MSVLLGNAPSLADILAAGCVMHATVCLSVCLTERCCRNLDLDEAERLAHENIKDIIACGFDAEKTFIFTDFGYLGGNFSRNIKRIERYTLATYTSMKEPGNHPW